ncbi:MAG: protein translocase subunit SecD [Chthoniobacterales bacterium]
MSAVWTFIAGMVLLILLGWYFVTESALRKRVLGLVLTILLAAFCIQAVTPPKEKIRLGLDLQGGTSFLIKLVINEDNQQNIAGLLDQAVEVIRKRIDKYGVSEPVIQPVGKDHIRVEIAGLDTAQLEETKGQLQRVAKLEFALVHPQSGSIIQQLDAQAGIIPPGFILKTAADEEIEGKKVSQRVVVRRAADMTGEHVLRAFPYYDQQGYGVSIELDSVGKKQFGDLTAQHIGQQLAILLDGEVQSAPSIRSAIPDGHAQISGHFSEKQARELASVLENPLRVPVKIEETRSISATLGTDSIRSGIAAGLLGLVIVMIGVLIYYRFAGLVALVGLALNVLILFGSMALFHFTLTLPGIAGIMLTIGMAVDANVLIYERLREEMATGKSLSAALTGAYEKAFHAIFDANVTTLITAVILFWQASGAVQGFAITLTLGIIASMFSALLFTRTAFSWLTANFGLKRLRMMDISPKRTFDFLGQRHIALVISLVLILGSIGVFAVRGKANFGIDFVGGDYIALESNPAISVTDARSVLEKAGLAQDATIQIERQGENEYLTIRTSEGKGSLVQKQIESSFPQNNVKLASEQKVGAQIGKEFAKKSLIALGLGIIGVLIYVTLRFEFSFALGAIVALIHDIVITIGIFSFAGIFSGRELSLVMVGAILTIAGYSINDTIVVYDRIREGLHKGTRGTIQELMNKSINETLGRTILTGGSTLLSISTLFFLGGPVMADFAFAILIGILVGTYSSVFIAAPTVLWWSKFTGKSIRREVLESSVVVRPAQ